MDSNKAVRLLDWQGAFSVV